jgi:tripartite-type tricarboxylate transporter receptor subunit TctC
MPSAVWWPDPTTAPRLHTILITPETSMQRRPFLQTLALAAAATTLMALPLAAAAQDRWPTRAIEIIYPYPPGNDMDVVTRLLAEGMSRRLGVPVQVINKPGGGGVVGFAEMVRAKPDGYTIGTWTPGPGISQIVAGNTPYKMADYQAVGGMLINDFVLATRADIPATNLKEFAAWAKKHGKPVVVGSYAPAAVPALIVAKIARRDGWPYKVVAFGNPSAKELTAGDADMTTTGAEMVSSYHKAGQVKVVSAWGLARNPLYPTVATPAEEGYGDLYTWGGMAAPAGVPKEIIARLSQVMAEALMDKPVQDQMKKAGIPPMQMTAEQMSKRVAEDSKWIAELMNELGMVKK